MIWLWALSLLVLIGSIIFVYRILSTSKELFSIDSHKIQGSSKTHAIKGNKKSVDELNKKIKSLEETTLYYQTLFSDFKDQLKLIENHRQEDAGIQADSLQKDGEMEEDWKELYFEENEKKEAIENELDRTCQRLEDVEKQMQENIPLKHQVSQLQMELQGRDLEIEAQKGRIDELQKMLNAKSNGEDEMEEFIHQHKQFLKEQDVLRQENARLRACNEDLKDQVAGLLKDRNEQDKTGRRNCEIESVITTFNLEKSSFKNGFEKLVHENRMFRY